MAENILIIGASSAIAHGTAKAFAAHAANFLLLGRHQTKLEAVRNDLLTRGAGEVYLLCRELADCDQHAEIWQKCLAIMPEIQRVLISYGTLTDQKSAEQDFQIACQNYQINFLSQASFANLAAQFFESKGRGQIAVVSSVAGDRGRQSNYIYGSAKAAMSSYLQGLRNRLQPSGVEVLTIKPGFVDTPMTASIKKGPLFANADQVGRAIHRAMLNHKNTVYVPAFWRLIMLIIKHIPESLFKRMKL